MKLRPYQIPAVEKGVQFFSQKDPKPSVMVLPTAAGKSIIIAFIVKELKEKVVVLQPSKELLEQNYEKFTSLGHEASIYSASKNTKEFGNVTYATIGSIKSLGKEFKSRGYKYLIIDEVHLYPRKADSMFGTFLKESEIKTVLGLTATPFKLQTNSFNGEGYSILKMLTSRSKHGNFFKDIIHVTQIQELTSLGYWSKIEYELYDVATGDLVFNSTKAEYTEESLNKFYKEQDIEIKIINRIQQAQDRKRILVFVPSVEAADRLSKKVKNSASISAMTSAKDREQIIKDYKDGKLKTVFNVNVLSVGFDYPEIDCIICGRPTASLAWLYQAFGRGTRIHPSKDNCLIVDFTNNVNTFGKIEDLVIEKDKYTWKVYGSGNRLLTGVPIHEIRPLIETEDEEYVMPFGKHKGIPISEVPFTYLQWVLKEFEFNDRNMRLKEEILKIRDKRMQTLVPKQELDMFTKHGVKQIQK